MAWGVYNVDGVEFFLEKGKPYPEFCPVPLPDCDCPHITATDTPVKLPYLKKVYLSSRKPETCNVKITDDVYFYGTGSFKLIKERSVLTNYVPLFVLGFPLDKKNKEWFARLATICEQGLRPVIVVTSDADWICCPSFVERLK